MKKRMRFGTWCRKDPDDERLIAYAFTDKEGRTMYFTSEDDCSYLAIERIRNAWIKEIKLVKNCFTRPEGMWHAELYED